MSWEGVKRRGQIYLLPRVLEAALKIGAIDKESMAGIKAGLAGLKGRNAASESPSAALASSSKSESTMLSASRSKASRHFSDSFLRKSETRSAIFSATICSLSGPQATGHRSRAALSRVKKEDVERDIDVCFADLCSPVFSDGLQATFFCSAAKLRFCQFCPKQSDSRCFLARSGVGKKKLKNFAAPTWWFRKSRPTFAIPKRVSDR